jgi:hypothetical protein
VLFYTGNFARIPLQNINKSSTKRQQKLNKSSTKNLSIPAPGNNKDE